VSSRLEAKGMPCDFALSRGSRPLQTGFTLIEVLVVLIMTGTITGVLFQALERAYRLQDRFGVELLGAQQGQMTTDWYRQTVQGLRSDYPNGKNLFKGSEQEFSGLSDNSLGSQYGAPTPIRWQIRTNLSSGQIDLVYLEQDKETPILSWSAKGARFVYVDDQHTQHDTWPPPFGQWPQLPKQIRVTTLGGKGFDPITIVASPISTAIPPPRLEDL
jgi:prepilin-type N-terminal cleavage/methylation domain-containing protein